MNRQAASYLRKARLDFGEQTRGRHYSQKEFAALLAVKVPELTPAMYRSYENRQRHVPADVLIAAVQLTGYQIVLGAEAEQALIEKVVQRLQKTGLVPG